MQFARLYPLTQQDLEAEPKHVDFLPLAPSRMAIDNPSRDYTPPKFVTLLFTDLGVLTPAAVSDELIQLCAHVFRDTPCVAWSSVITPLVICMKSLQWSSFVLHLCLACQQVLLRQRTWREMFLLAGGQCHVAQHI